MIITVWCFNCVVNCAVWAVPAALACYCSCPPQPVSRYLVCCSLTPAPTLGLGQKWKWGRVELAVRRECGPDGDGSPDWVVTTSRVPSDCWSRDRCSSTALWSSRRVRPILYIVHFSVSSQKVCYDLLSFSSAAPSLVYSGAGPPPYYSRGPICNYQSNHRTRCARCWWAGRPTTN